MFKMRSRPRRPRRWTRRRTSIRGYAHQEIDLTEDVVAQYQEIAEGSSYVSATKGQPYIPNRFPAISEKVRRNGPAQHAAQPSVNER